MNAANCIELVESCYREAEARGNPPPQNNIIGLNKARDVLQEYGQLFEPQPLPPEYEQGERGECFYNSAQVISAWPPPIHEWCEGFCWNLPNHLPCYHVWCVVEGDNRVIDTTLANPERYTYFGVRFSWDTWWTSYCENNNQLGVLINDGGREMAVKELRKRCEDENNQLHSTNVHRQYQPH